MHKGYYKTVAILITFVLFSALLCIPVSASSVSVSMPISQPNVSDTFGYVEVVTQRTDGSLDSWVFLVSFFTTNEDNNVDPFCSLTVSTRSIKFSDRSSSSNTYMSIIVVNANGNFTNKGTSVSSGYITSTFSNNIVAVRPYGPFLYNDLASYNVLDVDYIYGSDNIAINYLASILAAMPGEDYIADAITDNADKNAQNIQQNANQNAQDIQDNQDKNTQEQIQADNDRYEQEKQEIQSSGNQASDAADSIPNESDGFIDALGTFVSTMSTTSTDCILIFPAIKIPSIAGIPATTLSEEREVDISAAVNLIPSDIMKLIQALTTIALIVYCFKELYDTISEALTRKKANSDG